MVEPTSLAAQDVWARLRLAGRWGACVHKSLGKDALTLGCSNQALSLGAELRSGSDSQGPQAEEHVTDGLTFTTTAISCQYTNQTPSGSWKLSKNTQPRD